ncbi:unnamed protein product [Moneuplotes crassus]|uniref:Uncharacterized protein n=1 Tax=Euplotes crassus TaxID=5936 RepID=A0AAD1Y2J0_EUPCR|nr:unnamed protein product [Moneuplotes crassus]
MALKTKYSKPENQNHWEAKYFKMSPTDKLLLARNRIWGNMIGGMSARNGFKVLKQNWDVYELNKYYDQTQINQFFPGFRDHEEHSLIVEKYEYRRLRADIREMKIGQTDDNDEGSTMAMFELKARKASGTHI